MAEILHPTSAIPQAGFVSDNLPTEQAPSNPHAEPYGQIAVPDHVSTSTWQQSWYDPSSAATVSNYKKLPSGPCSLETGHLTGEGFPSHMDEHGGFSQV